MDKTEYIPKIRVAPADAESAASRARRVSDETLRIPVPPAGDSDAGTLPAQYSLLHKIGEGGMGIVYLAFENLLGRHVAIKCLKRAMAHRPSLLKRFFREAKAIAALSHNHIVHVYAMGEDAETPYIVMEYVEGPGPGSGEKLPAPPYTLTDRVADEGPFPVGEALGLVIKLCQAVGYAHNRGVIHRDLKPANILFDKSDEPKIVDFGLARRLDPGEEQLTRPGERMLSMGYGAPEQEAGAPIDHRADIYGLGAILFFCLTGENPRYFRPNSVPESLRDILVKALDTDREKRWASARDFEQRLALVQAPSGIDFPTTRVIWRCKWCQNSNPAVIRYCETCGWDGAEHCLECGAETRIGIQFCGRCGADAREYEIVAQLAKRLQSKWNEKDYAFIVRHAGQVSGFQPVGPSGQAILDRIARLKRDAQETLRRLEDIRQTVPREIEKKNFLLVRKLIREYDSLSADRAFVETTERLPALMLDREIGRIRSALAARDWRYAARLARDTLSTLDPNHGEARRLLRNARIAPWWFALRNTTFVLAGLFALYLLGAAPAQRLVGDEPGQAASFFSLAHWIHGESFLRQPLQFYAGLWGADLSFLSSDDLLASSQLSGEALAGGPGADALATLSARFGKARLRLETEHAHEDRKWGDSYLDELRQLQMALQEEGDFDGWLAVKSETDRFHEESDLYPEALAEEPDQLREAQERHLQTLAKRAAERQAKTLEMLQEHLQELETLRRELTKLGRMDEAAKAHAEMRRIQASAEFASDDPL